jgi:cytochrome c biogenesis protein CcmG/thiol:disulfide interchange protein DsbE
MKGSGMTRNVVWLTVGLFVAFLGCDAGPVVELPEKPVAPPAEETAAEDSIPAPELSSEPLYPFEFNLPSVDGTEISSSQFKGSVLIADVCGTWCPPCRMEVPYLVDLKNRYNHLGLKIVWLTYERGGTPDEQLAGLKQFIQEHEIDFPCLIGDRQTRDQIPNFSGYPTKVFIDRQGNVRQTLKGLQSYETLDAVVTELLEEG